MTVADGERNFTPTDFARDVLAGLALPQKAIPARWLYDQAGSELFEAITELPEYYPTRTETGILTEHGAAIGAAVAGRTVVEFGSGSSTKTPLLLSHAAPLAYVAIDISGDFLRASVGDLQARFPGLRCYAVEGDFMAPVALPGEVVGRPMLGFFPGSTIGNMGPAAAVDLLRSMRRTLGEGAALLIGFDRVKPVEVLIPAYDDAAGVTAAFNRNLLTRINRELGGDMPLDAFAHEARWNEPRGRIEMHLVAQRDVAFTVAGQRFAMAAGETIHTENSHKYALGEARRLLEAGGWTPAADWSDREGWFSLVLAHATPLEWAP